MRVLLHCRRVFLSKWSTAVALSIAFISISLMTMTYGKFTLYSNGKDGQRRASHGTEVNSRQISQVIFQHFHSTKPNSTPNNNARNLSEEDNSNLPEGKSRNIFNENFRNISRNTLKERESVENITSRKYGLPGVSDEGKIRVRTEDQGVVDSRSTTSISSSLRVSSTFVVIMAQWRFGSSIIGELFNQNPNIFFLFEPLWLLDKIRNERRLPFSPFPRELYEYSTKTLRDIAACNVTEEFVRLTNPWGGLINNRAICQATGEITQCKFRSSDMVNNLCTSYNGIMATKIIRADLGNIKPLVVEDKVNVKVIHLVRDPRGSAASRIHYYFEEWSDLVRAHEAEFQTRGRLAPLGLTNSTERIKDCIPTMCKWMRETLKEAKTMPDWLRGRYHLLRYEDFAAAPLNTTEDLYRFVGLPLPQSVREWVRNNSQAKDSDPGTFSVHKNSRKTAQKWMKDLRELEIEQVEHDCGDVMEDLGYQRFATLKLAQP
ncbi:carbohydrate sulfotransferase 4-like [Lytechinus variegatus]|uniref:carbohydrate sulfotransferase 4-like n=1 Tax=Lytechinus variegatus TaxID=7654 RepID=UPI001BB2A646|nr:carbohydrate sulfotransferase 4-like [Lytechinus variegatus]